MIIIYVNIRDKQRYENLGRNERELETVVGPVQYQRRYYRDKEQGVNVYLLDRHLGIRSYQRVSDGLVDTAGMLAVVSSSLREARDRLTDFASCQVLSHEGIRQLVLKLGKRIETEDSVCAAEVRQADCLFIEADGLYVNMQRSKGRQRREVKMSVLHEGWQARSGRGATADYELINPHYRSMLGPVSEFWETVQSDVYELYSKIEQTMVVINGDDAPWIRQGTDYFYKSMYQRDRYHVARDVRQTLRSCPQQAGRALQALRQNDVGGVLTELAVASKQSDCEQHQEQLQRLISSLLVDMDNVVDYRERLRSLNIRVDTSWRGMGAAESNIKKYKRRLGRGRSWSEPGLSAMVILLDHHHRGSLQHKIRGISSEVRTRWQQSRPYSAGDVPKFVGKGTEPRRGHFPALDQGRGSLVEMFRQLCRVPSHM